MGCVRIPVGMPERDISRHERCENDAGPILERSGARTPARREVFEAWPSRWAQPRPAQGTLGALRTSPAAERRPAYDEGRRVPIERRKAITPMPRRGWATAVSSVVWRVWTSSGSGWWSEGESQRRSSSGPQREPTRGDASLREARLHDALDPGDIVAVPRGRAATRDALLRLDALSAGRHLKAVPRR